MIGLPLVIGGSRVAAGLMTNPKFIGWLAQGIKIAGNKGVDGVIQHMGKLGVIMANADSETRQFIYEYLQMLQGKKGNSIMATQSQKNEKEIIKLQGELKLINNKIDTIKNNHLQHIDYKINNIYKLIWLILTISISGLVNLVITLLQ